MNFKRIIVTYFKNEKTLNSFKCRTEFKIVDRMLFTQYIT